ncbi:hypothetical protein HK097_000750 [Rhizophlyctis rosea]|uniref:GHMP kinase N-terminal domain-containing protein n=1 Tax=Rhizophlyctis rosea TaxID=64517 RepID=A0AAD5S580_9FUNG|nr:hypothetical protein HK097_000750 [Rhizophlyctis rosea]
MHLKIHNPIPLGRGLGSSGAAVVSGVLLASLSTSLNLTPSRILDYCTLIEGHPDNIAASLHGGFVASFLSSDISDLHKALHDKDLVLDLDSDKYDDSKVPRLPYGEGEEGLTRWVDLGIHKGVKAVVVVPDFELKTKVARSVLPGSYGVGDVVFNLQRVVVLATALKGGSSSGWGAVGGEGFDRGGGYMFVGYYV